MKEAEAGRALTGAYSTSLMTSDDIRASARAAARTGDRQPPGVSETRAWRTFLQHVSGPHV